MPEDRGARDVGRVAVDQEGSGPPDLKLVGRIESDFEHTGSAVVDTKEGTGGCVATVNAAPARERTYLAICSLVEAGGFEYVVSGGVKV